MRFDQLCQIYINRGDLCALGALEPEIYHSETQPKTILGSRYDNKYLETQISGDLIHLEAIDIHTFQLGVSVPFHLLKECVF